MAEAEYIILHRVIVGGEPIYLDCSLGILNLAGDDYTFEKWRELSSRIEGLYRRYNERKHEKSGN